MGDRGIVSLRALGLPGPRRCLIRAVAVVVEKLLSDLDALLGEDPDPVVAGDEHHLQ